MDSAYVLVLSLLLGAALGIRYIYARDRAESTAPAERRPRWWHAKGDGFWSQSECDSRVWWYGVPGSGCHYWTQRFGQYWVSGGVHVTYGSVRYECGGLGPPVKAYEWLSEFAAWGQWFEKGAIFYRDGAWRVVYGDWGQTAGR